METNITHRRPRPLGLTQLSIEYRKEPSQDNMARLYTYMINQWYINSGSICGIHYDVNTLVSRFGIPKEFINLYMRNSVMNSHVWDKDHQEELINGLLGEQLSWLLEDRMEIVNQVNLLKASQGGKYVPFISAELNKALKLRLDSSSSLQNMIKGIMGSGNTTNIFAQFNQQNNEVQEAEYITIDEARQIIQESVQLEDKTAEAKYLESKYDFSSLPEVVATNQSGVDTSKEGLSFNKIELTSVIDNYKGAIESSDKDHHEIRREIEQNIDPDSDDPELDLYEEIEEEEEILPFGKSNYLMPQ